MTRAALIEALEATCRANEMHDGVHIRLMVTRGMKRTPSQDPRQTIGSATVVIVAEYKVPADERWADAVHLRDPLHAARSVRHGAEFAQPAEPDPGADPGQQGRRGRGADAGRCGFVASCNATNFFCVRDGVVLTSTGRNCFSGITRGKVIGLVRAGGHADPAVRFHAARCLRGTGGVRERDFRRRHAGALDRWARVRCSRDRSRRRCASAMRT